MNGNRERKDMGRNWNDIGRNLKYMGRNVKGIERNRRKRNSRILWMATSTPRMEMVILILIRINRDFGLGVLYVYKPLKIKNP